MPARTGRTVLVTGCSSGIGRLAAVAFARTGEVVYGTVRDDEGAAALQRAAEESGVEISVVRMDVSNRPQRRREVDAIIGRHGAVDVLVNNAGIACSGAVEMLPDELVEQVWATNFFAPTELIKQVLPGMRAQHSGHIVNISSITTRNPPGPISWCYHTSKVALSVMSEALAHEVADFGIVVRAVEPGFHRSELAQKKIRQVEATGAITNSPYRRVEQAVDAYISARATTSPDPAPVVGAILAAGSATDPWPVRIPVDANVDTDAESARQSRMVDAALAMRRDLGLT